MSRFLFVVPPLAGHINPAAGVAAELEGRGHRTAWVCEPGAARRSLPAGIRLFPADRPAEDETFLSLTGMAAIEHLWEKFILPLGHMMIPAVEHACDEFAPHVIVADQQALAGPLVARRRGVSWATSATTSAELVHALAELPKVDEWAREQVDGFQRWHGVDDPVDLRFSPDLILAFTVAELAGGSYPAHYTFVGTSTSGRPRTPDFPWKWLDARRRHVLVSLGTLNGPAGGRFFDAVARAAAEMSGVQFVCVAPEGAFPSPPPNLLARPEVPQIDLLPHIDAVVCHAGHNTVCEALAFGIPLVVAPIRHDQPAVAEQVVRSGAGMRIRFGRVRPHDLVTSVTAVLEEPGFRDAARRLASAFQRAGGAPEAARRLEELVLARSVARQ